MDDPVPADGGRPGRRRRRTARPLSYALDVLLAASLLALDLPRVWTTYPSDYVVEWQPSTLAVVLVVLQTMPIAVRRLAPVPVLVVTTAAVIIYAQLPGQPEPDYVSVCVAVYTVAADVPPRVSLWCCGTAAVVLPAVLALDVTLLGIFRPLMLIVLVSMLGLERRRAILDRVRAAAQRIQQQSREQAIRTAQQDLRRREHIARTLHDGLARSLTLMTVHAETLRTATGTDAASPRSTAPSPRWTTVCRTIPSTGTGCWTSSATAGSWSTLTPG